MHPDYYHISREKNKNCFEGWYLRLTTQTKKSYSFIFGVARGKNPHSFIQVIDGSKNELLYFEYDIEEFSASSCDLNVNIEGNSLTYNRISLNSHNGENSIKGDIKFSNLVRWDSKSFGGGSMGILARLPFLECYTQMCLISGIAKGSLTINGERVCLDNSAVYMEKNWGKSFPKWWLWVQSNVFEDNRASFSLSVGRVPVGELYFTGVLGCLMVDGREYKFSSLTGTKIKIKRQANVCRCFVSSKDYRMAFTIEHNEGVLLKAPRKGSMSGKVCETLSGVLAIKLYCRHTGCLIYNGKSFTAGAEFGGIWQDKR